MGCLLLSGEVLGTMIGLATYNDCLFCLIPDLSQYWLIYDKMRIYGYILDHEIDIASIYLDPGSVRHKAFSGSCLFNLVAKKSMLGFSNF